MNKYQKICALFYIWWIDISALPRRIKRRVGNKHIQMWWHRLWIRKNEFHSSLDMNTAAMLEMNMPEIKKYMSDLLRRRSIAHQRGLVG